MATMVTKMKTDESCALFIKNCYFHDIDIK